MMPLTRPLSLLKNISLSLLFAFALLPSTLAQSEAAATQQPNKTEQTAAPLKLRWPSQPRVKRYRLQVALDKNFTDIVFDRAVLGLEQEVGGLQPGIYFWRVAPATKETGRYSSPALVQANIPMPTVPVFTVLRPPADVGWQAAIGAVARPFAARLRPGKNFDLIAMNSDGAVFALDGSDGSALWIARARVPVGEVKEKTLINLFTPVVLPADADNKSIAVIASGDGIRGLDGESGREMWRTVLEGRLAGGTVALMQGENGAPDIVVAINDPDLLYVLEGKTGKIVSKSKLNSELIGTPIPFTHGEINGVAIATKAQQLEIRRRDGSVVRAIKFDVPFTTPPLVIATPRGTLVVIGTKHGLLFFEGSELKPLGRITTEKDVPRGRLTAADMDNDGTIEIVMMTENGRVAVISTAGKVNWAVEGATDAYMATFANLDNDGVLDVVVPSATAFALGFSGRDGTLIWRADENVKSTGSNLSGERMLRSLTGVISTTGVPLLVGGDGARSSVRAVGLPVSVTKATVK